MQVKIIRCQTSLRNGTIGILVVDGEVLGFTLERYYLSNQRNVSCIPASQYRCISYESERHGKTYKVTNVDQRNGIIFHTGNFVYDSEGCILVGTYIGKDGGIAGSKDAMKKFIEKTNGCKEFTLSIVENY